MKICYIDTETTGLDAKTCGIIQLAATDAALEAVYVARWQARNASAPSTEQPRPSALSRIWAILRGRG